MRYTREFSVDSFPWWSGAMDTVEDVRRAGKMDELQGHLEMVFADDEEPPTDTQVNDYVWFKRASIYRDLGLDENGELPDGEEA